MRDFAGKHVLITGASAGIGQALAVELARRHANLTLAARDERALAETQRLCEAAGGGAFAFATDVTDADACGRLVAAGVARFGVLDALVNNAGISMVARFDEVTDLSIFERLMRVNYLGAVYCTHHALPHLKRSRGLLVAVSSLTGKTGVPTRTGYAASKHAMQGFFDSLRVELRGSGVDVLVVSPGFVATDIRQRALGAEGGAIGKEQAQHHPGDGDMTVDECVRQIARAMAARDRELVMTARARFGLWVRMIAPGLVDRIAERAVRGRK